MEVVYNTLFYWWVFCRIPLYLSLCQRRRPLDPLNIVLAVGLLEGCEALVSIPHMAQWIASALRLVLEKRCLMELYLLQHFIQLTRLQASSYSK